MKITNLSATNALEITDLLNDGSSITQWQDGIRTLLIGPSEYRIVPNIQACNSVALKTLIDAGGKVTVDAAVEPDGTDIANNARVAAGLPTWEVGGKIYGMTATSLA
jgi:hypothetical protein